MKLAPLSVRIAAVLVAFGALLPALAADDLESLAARVQVLEAREAIRALILAYGQAHDHRDYRTFADLFASNGEWVGGLGPPRGPKRSSSSWTGQSATTRNRTAPARITS
jgi:hypothetical protein